MSATAVRDLYGVFGDPVDHSLSPEIQAVAFAQVARAAAYLPFHVTPDQLEAAFAGARTLGLKGWNVTLPHKEQAAKLVDSLEGDAAAIKAVNVVVNRGGKLVGYNTDTIAVQKSLDKIKFDVRGQRALILGAGGAARAVAYALGKAGASEVVVANRTFSRARDLCAALAEHDIEAVASPLSLSAMRELLPLSHVVVNATSVGLNAPDQSPLPATLEFDSNAVVVEMIYRPLKTKLLQHARLQHVQTVDGLEILIQQALASLSLWLNKPVDANRLAPLMRTAALEALL
jgi:shikimate dehydrogenase